MRELTDQQLMQSTPEDQALWLKWVQGLPGLEGFSGTGYDADGVRIPWGSGPHNMKAYREIVEIVKPKKMIEIGFNVGYGTAMWMELTGCEKLVSFEISKKAETLAAARLLADRYGDRFLFRNTPADEIGLIEWIARESEFDLIFIDGGHLEEDVANDLYFAKRLGIPWIALDDWIPRFGPGVQVAAKKFDNLVLIKEFGNTALMKWSR